SSLVCSFFFNPTATTAIYTLSLHDALPILAAAVDVDRGVDDAVLHGRSALLRAGVHGVLGCVGVVLAGRDGGGAQAGQPRTHAALRHGDSRGEFDGSAATGRGARARRTPGHAPRGRGWGWCRALGTLRPPGGAHTGGR